MIETLIDGRRRDLGGFEVERVLPHAVRRMIGPFVFFDLMGPVDMPRGIDRSVDVRPHPHIGLSTITYLFDGEIMHRDSVGSEQAIRPGEVNWMTAGRGITHSERFERARREGGRLHGIQAWVALPVEFEETDPAFVHRGSDELPHLSEDGVQIRLIAGEWLDRTAPVPVHSPLFYAHARLASGARLSIPQRHRERAAYVVSGEIRVGGSRIEAGRMAAFEAGSPVQVTAESTSEIMLLGGEPIGERFIEWNFVSSSKERIRQARHDWRAGRMKLPDLDNGEFIPLPPDPDEPASPMS